MEIDNYTIDTTAQNNTRSLNGISTTNPRNTYLRIEEEEFTGVNGFQIKNNNLTYHRIKSINKWD